MYNYMPLLLLLRQPHGLDPREPLEMSGLHSSVVASKCICYWEWGNNFPMGRRRATVVVVEHAFVTTMCRNDELSSTMS